jgi:nitroreductase
MSNGEAKGLDALLARPLLETIWHRRTHRVSRGISELKAGSMSYQSTQKPVPLSELEEAVLIATTGHTGLTMPDRPFQDPGTGDFIMAKPNVNMEGRTAGSPDNAQGTFFFMINDSGTYFLKKVPAPAASALGVETLVAQAKLAKVKLLDKRVDAADRDFPAYLDSNRFLSNQPGTTVFFPVVDLSHQYINGLMYLLTQPKGHRPTIVDDRNFYRKAGVDKWVRNGFLNGDLKVPLGSIGSLRTQIEADLLLQNLMLVADAMGLGAYIHASISPPVLLGDPKFIDQYGPMLGFDFATPKWRLLDILRWQVPLPKYSNLRAHPIGLKAGGEFLIKGKSPPYYNTMKAAVDEVMAGKFGPNGIYKDASLFERIYKGDFGDRYLKEAADYGSDVIACVTDICQYIYDTHGRFPAHVDAIHVPGVWIQVHHPDIEYYDRYFQNGLTEAHRTHDTHWHQAGILA